MKWNQTRKLWFLLFCLFIFFIYVNIFILFFFLNSNLVFLVLFFWEMLIEVSMGVWESVRPTGVYLLCTSNGLLLYADSDLFLTLNLQLVQLRLQKQFQCSNHLKKLLKWMLKRKLLYSYVYVCYSISQLSWFQPKKTLFTLEILHLTAPALLHVHLTYKYTRRYEAIHFLKKIFPFSNLFFHSVHSFFLYLFY